MKTVYLVIIVTICFLLHKTWAKTKNYYPINNIKIEKTNDLKIIGIKNRTCYYFDDIINMKDFDLANILFDEKLYENPLIYNVLYKTLYGGKP